MNPTFEASGFQLEITADGSPTLRHKGLGESMHHSGGAAAETWYIYGLVMQKVMQVTRVEKKPILICNIGLGLGYIEMVFAALARLTYLKQIKQPKQLIEKSPDFEFDSFEIVPDLQIKFQAWYQLLHGEAGKAGEAHERDNAVYSLACAKLLATGLDITETQLKQQLQHSRIYYHDDILRFTKSRQWNVICFDAFSKKSSGDLWTENFLFNFLQNFAAPDCVFTTYACTSHLKKALQKNNFTILRRQGFSGKRECTLAVRGNFMNCVFQTF